MDFNRFHWLCELEAENSRIEIKFTVQGLVKLATKAKAMLLTFTALLGAKEALRLQSSHHHLGLIRGNHLIFESLEKYKRTGKQISKIDW